MGQYECNYFDGGVQCWGFAVKVFYDIFGVRASKMKKLYDKENIKVGDYLRFGTDSDGHSAVVIARSGNTLTLVEGNFRPTGSTKVETRTLYRWVENKDGLYSSHKFGDWKYTAFSCNAVRQCSVCKEKETKTIKLLGDSDFNGKITAADARLILRSAVGLETLCKDKKH